MLEDYTPEIQVLRNGKIIEVRKMLVLTTKRYKETRQLFNLRQTKRRNLLRGQIERARTSKYSYDEAIWIKGSRPQAIAERYECSLTKAYAIKHYVRTVYGI